MSNDRAALMAVGLRCNAELRFFEMVRIRFLGHERTVYLGVGKHAIYLLRRDISKTIKGGEIYYAHIDKVIEDTVTQTDFMIVMNDNRAAEWESEKLFVVSDNRTRLLEYMAIAWQADVMYRFGSVRRFRHYEAEITTRGPLTEPRPQVRAFMGFDKFVYKGYSFFLPKGFKDMATAAGASKTGSYIDPDDKGCTMVCEVGPTTPLPRLEQMGKEHVRWTALEYKQKITAPLKAATVLRNCSSHKAMDLAGDIAQWTGWELLVKSADEMIACFIMRRKYVPPLLDSAQDIVVTFRAPVRLEPIYPTAELRRLAKIAADSLTSTSESFSYYPTMVQARADALLFDEESLTWLSKSLDIYPGKRTDEQTEEEQVNELHNKARKFVKSILKALEAENALTHQEILEQKEMKDIDYYHDPMQAVRQDLLKDVGGLCIDEGDNKAERKNAWALRVARYLAYCIDGGLFGGKFTMCDITDAIGSVNAELNKKLQEIIEFLLHVRDPDLTLEFQQNAIAAQTLEPEFASFHYNEKVMRHLVESGYLRSQFPKGQEMRYSNVLATLLLGTGTTSFKALICRQILLTAGKQEPTTVNAIVPSLLELVRKGSLFLATYATAALVNMTAHHDVVKNTLMQKNVVQVCNDKLRQTDEDLVFYILGLLVNLTKAVHHRAIVVSYGTHQVLLEILQSSYHEDSKAKLLEQLCAVVGQLCNEEDTRRTISKNQVVLSCLCHLFGRASSGSNLRSKVMFCLKQLCINDGQQKNAIGPVVMYEAYDELPRYPDNDDFTNNCCLLLGTLFISKENCKGLWDHISEQHKEITGDITKMFKAVTQNVDDAIEAVAKRDAEERRERLIELRTRLMQFLKEAHIRGQLSRHG
mmetsp:Transcript_112531/g.257752  ORF Transcript_112531/g.257752 Transcript_112531/m.257752 type:complete len:870 (+) Transcript_112531:173-2782(+)